MAAVSQDQLPSEAQGLVFDCDGTVLDTMPQHWKAWDAATRKIGLELTPQKLQDLAGKPAREIFMILVDE